MKVKPTETKWKLEDGLDIFHPRFLENVPSLYLRCTLFLSNPLGGEPNLASVGTTSSMGQTPLRLHSAKPAPLFCVYLCLNSSIL